MTGVRESSFEGEPRSRDAVRWGATPGGRPLAPATRSELEAALGHSFADVRVHTDAPAAAAVRGERAAAFTVGRDVYFAAGRYAPGTPAGRRLLAHELAHVVQQSGQTGQRVDAGTPPGAEHEAQAAADAVAARRPFGPRLRTPVRLARQAEEEVTLPAPAPEAAPAAEVVPQPVVAGPAAEVARFRAEQLDFARERIAAASAAIGTRLTELRAKPEAERPPLQAKVHVLERQLADALADRVRLLEQHLPELEQRQAAGEDVKAELASSGRELGEHREDLARLGGVFGPERGVAFEETYRTKVAGLHCMGAAYAGLATLRSSEESAEIQRQVEAKAKQGLKRKRPVNLDQFITVMDTANAEKAAGPRQRARWSRKHKTWTPTLESIVRGKVHPAVPGFYFFGLALAEAYHSVLIGVSTWEEPARTLWCDQYGCRVVAGTLDDFARGEAEGLAVPYPDWDSYLWQVVPPAAAGLLTRPEEAK